MTTSVKLNTRRSQRGFSLLRAISLLFVLAAIGLFVFELVTFSQRDSEERLSQGITVAGLDVGGMRPGEAVSTWEQAYNSPIVLYYENSPILLEPASIGFRINSGNMLAQARATADTGGSFWTRFYNFLIGRGELSAHVVPLSIDYQENLLEQFLLEISRRYDRPGGQPGYDTLTLTTYPGTPGVELDVPAALQLVDSALRDPVNRTVVLPIGAGQASRPSLATLEALIIDYLDSQGFLYDGQTTVASIYIMDLQTGEEINLLGDVSFSGASTIKVAILIDYFRHLTFAPSQEEAWLMANSLLCSNNSSSNLLMQLIGGGSDIFPGIASVTNTAQYIGARNTYINAPFDLGIAGQQLGFIPAPPTFPNPNFDTNPDAFNQITAEDIGTMFTMIYDCANYGSGLIAAFPNGEFTQRECRQMLELMSGNHIQRLLEAGVPSGVRVSHKNGWISDMVADAGIVYPPNGRDYVIAVYIWEEGEFQDFQRLWPILEEISRATWNYFADEEDQLLTRRTDIPPTAAECEGDQRYLPPGMNAVNLDDIDSWRTNP